MWWVVIIPLNLFNNMEYETIDRIIHELTTISKITKNSKVGTYKSFIIIEDNSIFQWYYRWTNADGRTKTSNRISEIINISILVSLLMMESPDKKYKSNVDRFYKLLNASRIGIENLLDTYKTDDDFIGTVRPLISRIQDHCAKLALYLEVD